MNGEPLGPVRVLVVDDHEVFRLGLEQALAEQPGIEVVGDAVDGDDGVARAAELLPDVVLMDLRMPGTGGVDATRRIREAHPEVRVLVLTASQDDIDVFGAIRAGANGYLLKDASVDEVAGAIAMVARGQAPISPMVAPKVLAELNALSRRAEEWDGHARRLTSRELDVLRLVARGLSNRQIANDLVISENTVRNHVRNILEKLRVRSRVEAAAVALRDRLVDDSGWRAL
jgi:two-component system NarL family response regulator